MLIWIKKTYNKGPKVLKYLLNPITGACITFFANVKTKVVLGWNAKKWIIICTSYNANNYNNKSVENLAFGGRTWQQYPWPDKSRDFGSENAVDGLYKNRSEVGGQCAISDDGKYTATWRVYLGEEVSISHIDIYYRTDNKPSE